MINPATGVPFTTADVDRILRLADMFLEDWKENEGKDDPECAERQVEWAALRPLLLKLPELTHLQRAVESLVKDGFMFITPYQHAILAELYRRSLP